MPYVKHNRIGLASCLLCGKEKKPLAKYCISCSNILDHVRVTFKGTQFTIEDLYAKVREINAEKIKHEQMATKVS